MRILNQANKFMMRHMGYQGIEPGVEYVPHKYLIRDGDLIYNALTNEALRIDDWEAEKEYLIKYWYYVPEWFDIATAAQIARSKQIYIGTGPEPKKALFVIFTTTGCNASCEYCFELGGKVLTMAEDTAEDVAEYISENTNHDATVKLRWFGGEPLVNKRAINTISSELNQYGVNFASEMLTNGDLFNQVTDDEIELWNLKYVQFTLDDTGPEYDRIKGLPEGAYERLKKTVRRMDDLGIHVSIRVHLDPAKGTGPAKAVVDDFKDFTNVGMYARILYGCESKENYDTLLELEDYIVAAGKMKHTFREFRGPRHCMADSPGTACITPDGRLSPCEHYAYGCEMYGTIYTKRVDTGKLREWIEREKYQKKDCSSCVLFPGCKKLVKCPAEGKCSEGYSYYQTESIKRAMRERT